MNNLIDCLVEHEGRERYVYNDSLGLATIGVGRCVAKEGGRGLSFEEQNFLLNNDIALCKSQLVAKPYYVNQSTVRQEVLIELCFNMGIARLEGFKMMLDAFTKGDYGAAAAQLKDSKWAVQVGSNRLANLSKRIVTDAY